MIRNRVVTKEVLAGTAEAIQKFKQSPAIGSLRRADGESYEQFVARRKKEKSAIALYLKGFPVIGHMHPNRAQRRAR